MVVHGSESWTHTGKSRNVLLTWVRKISKRIFGPKKDENGGYRRLEELDSFQRSPNTVRLIKSRRLR